MSGEVKHVAPIEVDERLAALLANASAVRAIASAVEGTLGPKGLNCMLVDRLGDVTVTNDGSTILSKIDVSHPAARMVINTAKAQEVEVGDGTTTTTILANALIAEGVSHASRGVPVTRIIEGMRAGLARAVAVLREKSVAISDLDDPVLRQVAIIAGREQEDLADLALEAARLLGAEKLREEAFRLAEWVVAKEGAQSQVLPGLVIEKERLSRQMPREVKPARILVVDDALEPEEVEEEALGTEAGFQRYLALREAFREDLQRLVGLGVRVVVVHKGVDSLAEEILTEAGVMVVRRVSSRDIAAIAEHTGARPIKRHGLRKEASDLRKAVGRARRVYEDERLEHLRILGGRGAPAATMLVGAATAAVKEERQRIAQDAASAVQQAVRGGIVAGGGAAELSAIPEVERVREQLSGMAAYGADCVIEALRRPLRQIVANAGFNPLEKLGDVLAARAAGNRDSLGIDCDTGQVADMMAAGVVDATTVKVYAIEAAGEIAEAILRINTIIRKREESVAPLPGAATSKQAP